MIFLISNYKVIIFLINNHSKLSGKYFAYYNISLKDYFKIYMESKSRIKYSHNCRFLLQLKFDMTLGCKLEHLYYRLKDKEKSKF